MKPNYADTKSMQDVLNNVSLDKEVIRSGLPVIYDEKSAYITKEGHSLIIGSAGSGKTQGIVLPVVKLSLLAGESLVVNDPMGEIYKLTANEFKNRGYNVVLLDFNESIYGNYWNPFALISKLYEEGNTDKATDLLENIGNYIFKDERNDIDPFWSTSANNVFIGIALYFCEKKQSKDLSFDKIFNFASKLTNKEEADKLLKEIGTDNIIYNTLSGFLLAPTDTKGSIYSVFSQKLRLISSRENLNSMLSKSDFDLSKISKEKTIIYVTSGLNGLSKRLIPMFINQVVETLNIYGNNKNFNIILDELDKLNPISNFPLILNYSRGLKISFIVNISSYIDLINMYGKEETEIIKYCFSNIVYLYTNDIYTINEISTYSGNIPVQELQTIKKFEAIYLITRMLPYKTKLVPDYQINWGFDNIEAEFIKREKQLVN